MLEFTWTHHAFSKQSPLATALLHSKSSLKQDYVTFERLNKIVLNEALLTPVPSGIKHYTALLGLVWPVAYGG